MTTPDPILDLTRWLKAHPDGDARLDLGRPQVEALVAEWRRLTQSADRLRKQNRKVRKRIDRIRSGQPDLGDAVDLDEAGDAAAAEVTAPDQVGMSEPGELAGD